MTRPLWKEQPPLYDVDELLVERRLLQRRRRQPVARIAAKWRPEVPWTERRSSVGRRKIDRASSAAGKTEGGSTPG